MYSSALVSYIYVTVSTQTFAVVWVYPRKLRWKKHITCRGKARICICIHSHRERVTLLKTNNRAGTTQTLKPVARTDYGAAVFTPPTPSETRELGTPTFSWVVRRPFPGISLKVHPQCRSDVLDARGEGRRECGTGDADLSRTFLPWGCPDLRLADTPHTVRVPAFADDLRGLPSRLPLQRAFLVVREPHLLSRRDVARSDECELSQEVL